MDIDNAALNPGMLHQQLSQKQAMNWALDDKSSYAFALGAFRYLQQFQAFQNPYLVQSLLLLWLCTSVYLVYSTYTDYCDFLSLGPGGTPADLFGYMRIKVLSLFALKDTYEPAPTPSTLYPQTGYLSSLPQRVGSRPIVKGIAPQRQRDQRPSKDVFAQLERVIDALADNPEHRLVRGTSCFEKHGPGLFAVHPRAFAFSSYYSLAPTATKRAEDSVCLPTSVSEPILGNRPIQRQRKRPSNCPHEVCHAHPSDGSLHMTLHPTDVKLVLESGWGERHPLARGGWLERFVPGGFVMVYAPRTFEEVATVERIIKAAVWWIADDTLLGEKKAVN